jgi:hypothetical protein
LFDLQISEAVKFPIHVKYRTSASSLVQDIPPYPYQTLPMSNISLVVGYVDFPVLLDTGTFTARLILSQEVKLIVREQCSRHPRLGKVCEVVLCGRGCSTYVLVLLEVLVSILIVCNEP